MKIEDRYYENIYIIYISKYCPPKEKGKIKNNYIIEK